MRGGQSAILVAMPAQWIRVVFTSVLDERDYSRALVVVHQALVRNGFNCQWLRHDGTLTDIATVEHRSLR